MAATNEEGAKKLDILINITLFFLVRDLIDFQGRLPGAAIMTSIFAILSVFPFVILSPNLFVFLIFPIL